MFLAVEGEEQGLYGSKHAAETAKAAGQDIVAMLNNDIVGGDQTPGRENRDLLRVFSQGVPPNATPEQFTQIASGALENDSPSRQVARYASVARGWIPAADFRSCSSTGRIVSSAAAITSRLSTPVIAAVRFSEFNENSNHQHQVVREQNGVEMGDLEVDQSRVHRERRARERAHARVAGVVAAACPERVTFQAGQQPIGHGRDLDRRAGRGGYRVLMRPTAESQWTIRVPAPAGAGAAARAPCAQVARGRR